MKQILYISFFLFSVLSFGQQSYKVSEGELQFVHPEKGIIIKKNNDYYSFDINLNFDSHEISQKLKFNLKELQLSELENYKNNKIIIQESDIISYNFKEIKKIRFTETEEEDENQFYALNNEVFIYRINNLDKKQTFVESVHPYFILTFNHNKKIICFDDGFIIPSKQGLKLLFENKFKSCKVQRNIKLKPIEISTGHFSGISDYYKIDTLPNKKVVFKNLWNKNVFDKSFDSIDTNRDFIVGFNRNKIAIYNYQFKELPLSKIKAVKLKKYFPEAQIISNNSLIKINLLGKQYKAGDGPTFIDLSFQFPSEYAQFEIFKENNEYYISGELNKITTNLDFDFTGGKKYKLHHTSEIIDLEVFYGILLYTESGYVKKRPILIYSKLNNSKFNLNTFDYLLSENPSAEIERINNELPKNLDSIKTINNDIYLIKKNNLYTYFPIVKEIKYKKLDDFQENFARFELPNGQKGWLSLDGKEYFDE